MICSPKGPLFPKLSECKPFSSSDEYHKTHDENISPTIALLNLLQTGTLESKDNNPENSNQTQNSYDVASLLGSLIMNGLPLIGLHDFISFSDFINNNIGDETKRNIIKSTIYREKFSNFLDIRKKELRIVPNNCWSSAFIEYLSDQSDVFQVCATTFISLYYLYVISYIIIYVLLLQGF